MDLHTTILLALFCAASSSAAPASDSFGILVKPPGRVRLGHTATLPCWLSPARSAEGLEVRWYRHGRFNTPIIFYRGKRFEATQEASYMGRVLFGFKDAASGGLPAGNLSLKLENVTIEDEGDYTCYASSDHGHDSGTVSLLVTETGASPVLSAVWRGDNMVNVSCESKGWYPQPKLFWLDQNQELTPKSLEYSNVSSGHVSVQSWLLVSRTSEVSCSVGLPGEEEKEARVRLEILPQPAKQESGSLAATGWVAFSLLLLAMLALLGVLYFKKRENGKNKSKTGEEDKSRENQPEETDSLLPDDPVTPAELTSYYENIELEDTNNEYIKIRNRLLRDSGYFPDGEQVTCVTAVKGTPGFTSGKHYWEVSLCSKNVKPKKSWWIGVTNAPAFPQDIRPTPSNGFWFLSSSPDREDPFQFNTEPTVFLPVHLRPKKVGVYLNCDTRKLTFYNVGEKHIIGSITANFTGQVFPFFNPGKGDVSPMKILQKKTANSIDSMAQEPES